MSSIINKIRQVCEEAVSAFVEFGLEDDTDIKELSYESLSEIFPGKTKILIRSKIWKIIKKSQGEQNISHSSPLQRDSPDLPGRRQQFLSSCAKSSIKTALESSDGQSNTLAGLSEGYDVCHSATQSIVSSTPGVVCFSSSVASDPVPCSSSTPVANANELTGVSIKEQRNSAACNVLKVKTSHLQSPKYIIYQDETVKAAAEKGEVPKELVHRLVRGTIHCMNALSLSAPFNRYPTSRELEEMAKSLISELPALKDGDNSHKSLFKQLKDRLKNIKPVKNPQGPCQNKKKNLKRRIEDMDSSNDGDAESNASSDDTVNNSNSKENLPPKESSSTENRHYESLKKEFSKIKPSEETISLYLDIEYESRHNWIVSLPIEGRFKKIIKKYPCFSRAIHIIDEAGRIAKKKSQGMFFLQDVMRNLENHLDNLVFLGMSKNIAFASKPSKENKVIYLITNMHTIFPSKSLKKKPQRLFIELQEYEDPAELNTVKFKNTPLLVKAEGEWLIVCEQQIVARGEALEIFLAYLACYYLLDYDYPSSHEVAFTVLQYAIFEDFKAPKDLFHTVDELWKDYNNFSNA